MTDGRREYKMWMVEQISKHSYCTIAEAHLKATEWQDSPRYEESYTRWVGLNRDVILASNPAQKINFPNV